MTSDRRARAALIALLLAGGLAGCARPAGPVFETPLTPLRWPAPPEPTRIEYVGQIATEGDLKAGRNLGEAIGATIFGEDADRSMLSPYGVTTDGGDRLFVSDSNAQIVHVFDLGSRRYERWPASADEASLAQPLGVAWDPRGRLLVADAAAGCVRVFDANGRGAGTIGDGALERPSGVAVDGDHGHVYVVDAAAHALVVFGDDGQERRRVAGRGREPGRFNFPTNVTVDSAGNVYVADSLNFRVQVFDPDLRPIRQIGSQGDRPGYFSQPKGIAVDSDDHLYVVDAHFESVQIFDDVGRVLLSFGREGREPGEFWLPAGMHIDSSDRIWIADSYNRRVQVFQYVRVP